VGKLDVRAVAFQHFAKAPDLVGDVVTALDFAHIAVQIRHYRPQVGQHLRLLRVLKLYRLARR
jgi:hypothetical protein